MRLRRSEKMPSATLLKTALALLFASAFLAPIHAAEPMNHEELHERLKGIAKKNKKLSQLNALTQSASKHEVWILELGIEDDEERARRPAMLVVAGIEGNDLAGGEITTSWAESLIDQYETNQEIKSLLDTTTIYVIPRMNPDAAENVFAKPRVETAANDKPFDDDHDGLVDEDPADDLNGDGVISWMRIEDREGEYIPDPGEPRLMIKADPAKGEKGSWRYLPEGRDDDGDEVWNEDGIGGVNFNRNFPYNYAYFAADAGLHPVSETETRALADFIVSHPNIGIVFTFGETEHLLKTPEAGKDDAANPVESRTTTGRRVRQTKPATGIASDDLPYYRELGDAFRKSLGIEKELKGSIAAGSFSDWMYFHRGRFSIGTRAWSPLMQIEMDKKAEGEKKKDEAAKPDSEKPSEEKKSEEKKPEDKKDDKRNEDDRAILKWLTEHNSDAFVAWREFQHPDFKDTKVEIGGFAPYALSLPPQDLLEKLTARDSDFLTTVALRLPRIGIRKVEIERLGKSVFELKIQVENTGGLPTVLAHGETTSEVNPTRLVVDLEDKAFLSGARRTMLKPIKPGGMEEVRLTIHVPKKQNLEIEVISAVAGVASKKIEVGGD